MLSYLKLEPARACLLTLVIVVVVVVEVVVVEVVVVDTIHARI